MPLRCVVDQAVHSARARLTSDQPLLLPLVLAGGGGVAVCAMGALWRRWQWPWRFAASSGSPPPGGHGPGGAEKAVDGLLRCRRRCGRWLAVSAFTPKQRQRRDDTKRCCIECAAALDAERVERELAGGGATARAFAGRRPSRASRGHAPRQ
jgi:hypothetical protein